MRPRCYIVQRLTCFLTISLHYKDSKVNSNSAILKYKINHKDTKTQRNPFYHEELEEHEDNTWVSEWMRRYPHTFTDSGFPFVPSAPFALNIPCFSWFLIFHFPFSTFNYLPSVVNIPVFMIPRFKNFPFSIFNFQLNFCLFTN